VPTDTPLDPSTAVHQRRARTAPARNAALRNAALRATDDPATLARAARIVRAALERGRLSAADLNGEIVADGKKTLDGDSARNADTEAGGPDAA